MSLDLARGAVLVGKAEAPDMYAALDLAEQKLAHQLRRWKERLKDHHRGDRPKGAAETAGAPAGGDDQATYEDVIDRMRRGE
jgi:ribosome-associated translation inhibitor RaiA